MKKVGIIVLAATMFASVFTGCASSSKTTSNTAKTNENVTLTWAVFKDPTPAAQKIVDKFQEKNPNIKIKLQVLPAGSDAIHTALTTSLGAKDDSIDIVSMDSIWPAEFGSAGWVKPLNKYVKDDLKSQLLKGPMDGGIYKDNIYAMPWYTDAGLLYYRKDIVSTPPTTWDELLKMSKENMGKNGTQYGFEFQGKQFEGLITDYLEFLWANNGDVLKGDQVVLNSPEAVEALQYMVDLVRKDKVTPEGVINHDTEESRRVFVEGKSVFLRNWPFVWATTTAAESKVSGKVGMAPMPKGPKGTSGAASLGGWDLGISNFSKHPDEAWKFIEFAMSEEGQKINSIEGGRIPTLTKLFNDADVLAKNPHYKDLYPVFLAAKPRPVSPIYPAISGKMQVHIHKALVGEETPQAALDQAAKEINELLKK